MDRIIDYRGKTPPKAPSGVPLVTAKIIKDGRLLEVGEYIAEDIYDDWMRRGLPRRGDVVITTEAPMGEVAQLHTDRVALAQRVILLRGAPKVLDNTFLRFTLMSQTVQHRLQARSTGTTVTGIKQKELRRVTLPLPPYREQRRIAAVLGALDDKIELNRKMNRTLEEMAQALFKSWFIDFDGHDDLVDSELGPIPRGWNVETLNDRLSVLETGKRPKGGVAKFTSGVPSVGAESIVGLGKFDFDKTKYIPAAFFRDMTKGIVADRDVLVYKDGGKPGDFRPHVTMFGDNFPFSKYAINSHVYRLRTSSLLSQEYLYFWLSSDPMMAEMRRRGTGAAIPGIPRRDLMTMPVLVPPNDVHARFHHVAAPIVSKILGNAKQSRTLAEIRDTLLPKLISGELRVPEAAELIETPP
ncbi:restriction endonuclease subunit S [Pseudenhygromyxa sp. WMMC2535]|uniref:restriction endonuclease subunit S n=1 Tax=Pseudenhygromyxa sp. WMMC2535 TaxID=2712867 RepID=UPI001551F19B|nr:restriction endonuclease subunit S [Pseudenhygromyxa sp. WMMC2535]